MATKNNPVGAPAPRWSRIRGSKTLGVVMIVRNEVENLPALFETIREVADEVVVVDTGSRDGTQALCKRWGVTLLTDPWRDDFARARNRGIQAATSRYLIWLDADDRLPRDTQDELARLRDQVLPRATPRAYDFVLHNVDEEGAVRDELRQTRLFPRLPGVRFQNIVHEEVITSLDRLGIGREATDMVVVHTGYATAEQLAQKHARNEALLRRSIHAQGASVHHLVHLAHAVGATGRAQEAEGYVGAALELEEAADRRPRILAELHTFRALIRSALSNQFGAARDLERASSLWPEWAVPHGMLAEVLATRDDLAGAGEAIERARRAEFSLSVLGLNVRQLQAEMERTAGFLLRRQGEAEAALRCVQRALELDPKNLKARLETGQALLEADRFAEARTVLEPAGEDPAAVDRFVDVAAAIALARAMTDDWPGAAACLGPLLDIFAAELRGAQDVSPAELSIAAMQAGFPTASRNLLALFERTLAAAA